MYAPNPTLSLLLFQVLRGHLAALVHPHALDCFGQVTREAVDSLSASLFFFMLSLPMVRVYLLTSAGRKRPAEVGLSCS